MFQLSCYIHEPIYITYTYPLRMWPSTVTYTSASSGTKAENMTIHLRHKPHIHPLVSSIQSSDHTRLSKKKKKNQTFQSGTQSTSAFLCIHYFIYLCKAIVANSRLIY